MNEPVDELLDAAFANQLERGFAVEKIGMVLQRADGSIEACNPSAEQILGWTLHQVQGWSSIEFSAQSIHADGSPFPSQTYPSMETLRTGLPCRDVVMGLYRPDGNLIWLLINAQPLFQAGNRRPYAVVVTFADITEQKRKADAATGQGRQFMFESLRQNQQFTDRVIEMLPGMLHLFDAIEKRTLYVSPQATDLLGYRSEEILQPNFLDQVMYPDDRARLSRHFDRLQAAQTDELPSIEYRMRHANGEWRWFSSQDRIFRRTADGQVQQVLGIAQDISDRKQAESALQQSEATAQQQLAELEFIYATAPIGLCFLNTDLRFVRINDHLAEINGLPAAHHIGRSIREIIPEMADQLEPLYRQVIETGEPILNLEVSGTNRAQPKVLRDWLVSYCPLKQVDRVIGINVMVQEITHRKQIEQALQEREAQLQAILDNAPAIIFLKDTEGRFLFASRELERAFAWEDKSWFGKNAYDFFDRDTAEAIHRSEQEILHSDGAIETEETLIYQGEERTYASIKFSLKHADGMPYALCGISSDITKRKLAEAVLRESEARYRILAEAIPQFVFVTTPDGQNEYVNQQFCRYAGVPQAQLLGSGWLTILHPDDRELTFRRWLSAVQTGSFYKVEYRFRSADGQYRWFLGQGIPLKDDQGRVVKWFGTCTDIHEQKQIEVDRIRLLEQEQAARAQAEQANRIKDEFLAILSHELRTPLNPILGWSKLLQTRQFTPDKLKTALATIERNAQLQVQLIEDLLDVSRIIQGKLTLNLDSVWLTDAIEAALETVHLAAEAKSIAIETQLDPQMGAVLGDAGRLQQIIWNLLSNAVKFTPHGGRIQICLEEVRDYEVGGSKQPIPHPSIARLTISDTGKGISSAFLPHIFEAFRQQDGSTTRQFGGLGLGLAIVRQLVELHGGTITATSLGEGQGSTFTVCLPTLPIAHRIEPSLGKAIADLQNIRVLAVDDELDSLEILTVLLEQEGAIVTAVSSAQAAIDQLNHARFDLLISDIGMPEADGYVLIREVRAMPKCVQLPAIALTAYASETDQQQTLTAGYQHHLAKPVDPDMLIGAIAQLVTG